MPEQYRILFIEDNHDDRITFEQWVRRENLPYRYICVRYGAEAQNALQSGEFDVVLVAADHAAFNGPDTRHPVPVIAIINNADRDAAVNTGAYGYLVKDAGGHYLDALPSLVENVIARRHAEEELAHYRAHLQEAVEARTVELRKSEQNLARAQRIAAMGNWEWDIAADTLTWSDQMYRIFGVDCATFTLTYENIEARIHPDDRALNQQQVAQVINDTGANTVDYEMRLVRPDGVPRHTHQHIEVTRDAAGKAMSAFGIIMDITERKQAEIALAAERGLLRTLIDNLPDRIYVKNRRGEFTLTNRANTHQIGASTANQIIGKTDHDCYPAEIADRYHADDQAVMQTGQPLINREEPVTAGDGTEGWVLTSKVPLLDEQNNVTGLVGIGRDITERKRAEEALRESQRTLLTLMSNLPGMAYRCLTDRDWTMLFVSQGCTDLTGYAPADLLHNAVITYADLIHPDDREMVWQSVQTGIDVASSFQMMYRILTRDRREKWVWEQGREVTLADGTLALEGFIADITDRKQVEFALEQSEAKYRDIAESLPGVVFQFVLQPDGSRYFAHAIVNDYAASKTGFTAEILMRNIDTYLSAIVPEDFAHYTQVLEESARNLTSYSVEFRVRKLSDGEIIWLNARATPRSLPDGAIMWTGIAIDITERVAALEALRTGEEQYRLLFDSSEVLVSVYDRAGVCQLMNRRVAALFGGEPEDFIGQSFETLHPGAAQEYIRRTRHVIDTGVSHEFEDEVEFPTGKRWLLTRVQPVPDTRGHFHIAQIISQDITERKQAQEALNKRVKEIDMLYRASQHLSRSLDRDAIFQTVYQVIHDVMDCDWLTISGYDAETELITCLFTYAEGQQLDISHLPPLPLAPEGKGTQSTVIRTGQSIYFPDYLQALKKSQTVYRVRSDGQQIQEDEVPEGPHPRSALMVPMKHQDQVTGVIQVKSFRPGAYSDDDRRLLEALANQISTTLSNVRLFEQAQAEIAERKKAEDAERDQRQLAEALRDIASVLSGTLQLHEVMDRVLENVGHVVPHDAANVALIVDGLSRVIACRGYESQGLDTQALLQINFSVEKIPSLAEMIRTGEPFIVTDTARYDGWRDMPETRWVRSYLGTPIVVDDQTLGFISLDSATAGFFTPDHAERLYAFADHAAIAIRNAQLYQELESHGQQLEQAVRERTAELRSSEARYRGIVEDQTELICRFTPDGILTFVNEAYRRYFDKPYAELVGHSYISQVVQDDQTALNELLATLNADNPIKTVIHRAIAPGGEIRWLEWTNRKLFDEQGHFTEFQSVGRDITERKEAEEKLNQALAREMELNELKSRFVSMAAHDLRTPLAVIHSAADILQHYSNRLTEEQKQTKFVEIRATIQRMVDLLDDVLTIGQAEAGKFQFRPEPVELETFCRHILNEFQTTIGSAHTFDFTFSRRSITRTVDPKLLRHTLNNLLSNAIKYSQPGSTITFELLPRDDQTVFRVQDEGIGIPEADKKRLFEAFHRAANVGDIPGTGLGLAIVKQLVELHGGTITFESQVGVGTTFTVSLPR